MHGGKRRTATRDCLSLFLTGPDGTPIVWTMVFYNGSEEEGRAKFKWLHDLEPIVDKSKTVEYQELNSLINYIFPYDKGTLFHAVTFRHIDLPTIQKAFDRLIEVRKEGKLTEPAILYQFHHCAAVNAVPTSATAFRRKDATHTLDVLLSFRWDQSTGDHTAYARSVLSELEKILGSGQIGLNEHDKLGYGNHDADSALVMKSEDQLHKKDASVVFGENYPKLQEIKRKYDPSNVFNKWFSITPAAPLTSRTRHAVV